MQFGMSKYVLFMVVLLLALGVNGAAAYSIGKVSRVASFEASDLPEGIAVDKRGDIYVGVARTGEIKKVTPEGKVAHFAKLPSPGSGFMTGMAFDDDGYLYVALSSFDEATHGIWRVSPNGERAFRVAKLSIQGLPNGLAFRQGDLYVSDSLRGMIWKIDTAGRVRTWTRTPLLEGVAGPPLGIPIGANGIAFFGDALYAANTDLGQIVRILVQNDGGAGEAEALIASEHLRGGDGIAFDRRGSLYVTVNRQDKLVRIPPHIGIHVLANHGDGLDFPASVAFGKGSEKRTLYITNFAFFRANEFAEGEPRPGLLIMKTEIQGLPGQ